MRKRGLILLVTIILILLISVGVGSCLFILPNLPDTTAHVIITASTISGPAPLIVYFISSTNQLDNQNLLYEWDFDDGKTSLQPNPVHRYENPGEYSVMLTVTDYKNDIYFDIIEIIVGGSDNNKPIVTATANRTQGITPLNVSFKGTASDSDGTIVDYFWDFNDGTTTHEQNPTHVFENNGTYIVMFSATDNGGQTNSTTLVITVEEAENFVETAFVPWIVQTAGQIQLSNHEMIDSGDMYDTLMSRSENIQTFIDEALSQLSKFNLPDSMSDLRTEFRTCLESFKQCALYMYKGAVAMIKKEYSNADTYFDTAYDYKTNAIDSILRISTLID
jgi:hypothetical protein